MAKVLGTEEGIEFYRTSVVPWQTAMSVDGLFVCTNWIHRKVLLEYRTWRISPELKSDKHLGFCMWQLECLMCETNLTEFRDTEHITLLKCGHGGHKDCMAGLLQWIQECPKCQAEIVMKGTEPNKLNSNLEDVILEGIDRYPTQMLGAAGGFEDEDGNYVYYS